MMDILPWLGFGAFGVVLIFGLLKGKNKERGGGFFGMGFSDCGSGWGGGGFGGCGGGD
jgi:hypothetical protein